MKYKRLIIVVSILFAAAGLFAGGQQEETGKDLRQMQAGIPIETAQWVDVHGAGSQRSDPKSGDPDDYADGHGPQGDAIRIMNMVRPVRSFSSADLPYTIVGTNQSTRFDDSEAVDDPAVFYGQDADYGSLEAAYEDNGDGTVTDLNTGLMWQQDPGEKMSLDEAFAAVEDFDLGGYDDWRIPSIKELYSLIQFSGRDVAPEAENGSIPFIDTDYFDFVYGDPANGERVIDSQYMSSTKYVSTTMNGEETVFGVNFADGRIKGYGTGLHGQDKTFFVMFVRGDSGYGENSFIDNGDGTISDLATGLMWLQDDLGPMNWEDALAGCEALDYAGYDDWRLPDIKELQSIVDYERSPGTTGSAALDPLFVASTVINEAGEDDYGFYWSSTTYATSMSENYGSAAAYVAFGRSPGNLSNMEMPGAGGRPEGFPGPPAAGRDRPGAPPRQG